jgi:CRISPR/Cas system-associated exonuclease Cas4 (RecB family)
MVDVVAERPIIITHSDISNFLTCRRKWYYDYVLDYRSKEKKTGALALGTRVHAALEAYYGGETDDPVAWINQKGKEDLAELELSDDAKPWDLDQMYEDMIVGRNCIVLYMEWLSETNADANYRTVTVEEKVEAPILDGRVILRGKVDQLQEDITSGLLCVNDFKTTADWGGGLREQLERSYQHWCYLIGMQYQYPERNVECARYTVLRKVKKLPKTAPASPLVQRFNVPATRRNMATKRAQIERIALEMINLRDKTDQAVFYPAPGKHCTWCEYKAPCEISDESQEASLALLSNGKYVSGTRYARYETKENDND